MPVCFIPIDVLLCKALKKPTWSFSLNLYLKCTAQLRDLTDNCMCGVQRWDCHWKIMLNTIIAHRLSQCNLLCNLLSTFLLLNLFRLTITKGLNTYWLKTLQVFVFNSFVKHNSTTQMVWDELDRRVKEKQLTSAQLTVACKSIHPPWHFSYFVALQSGTKIYFFGGCIIWFTQHTHHFENS